MDSNGLITANSNGTATIKCETSNGKYITCQVNITTSGSGVYINKANVILDLNGTKQVNLKATIVPSSTVDKTITWTSSNPNIAYVDSNGVVTAKNLGKTTITATCGNAKATCDIIVKYNRSYGLYFYNLKTKTVTTEYMKNEGDFYAFYMYIPDTERCLNFNTLPIVMILHGGCGTLYPRTYHTYLQDRLQQGSADYSAIIIFPLAHSKSSNFSNNSRKACKGYTDYILNNYKANKKKVSVRGVSFGAAGAWNLMRDYPGFYSAVYVSSGWYNLKGINPKDVPPLWIIYGGKGGYSSSLINFCKTHSINYKYTDLKAPSNQHITACNHVFKDNSREVIEWLISK